MKYVKQVIIVLALLLVAYILIFGPRAETAPVKDRVVVQYWEKWPGKEAEQMQEIVNDFNTTVGIEKGIYVQYLSMSSIHQKTLVSTAAGVPPDVAGLWDGQVAQFAAMDALEPLDEMAAAHGITESYYKPVYWRACRYHGKLYALISTPAAVALHYNKQMFLDRAAELRAAGLDPERAPRTLQELDAYAKALDVIQTGASGDQRIVSSGYLPMEPGWFVAHTGLWFGVRVFDGQTGTLQLNDAKMVQALEWIQSYSKRLGVKSMGEFRSGFGQFNSTQNPFLTDTVAMVQQGPWMSNYIEILKPSMNRWHVPPEKLVVEKKYDDIAQGMTFDAVKRLLGEPQSVQQATDALMTTSCTWDAGIKTVRVDFADGTVRSKSAKLLPAVERRKFCQWGVVPFPAAEPSQQGVTYCGFDTLVIPKGAKHKKEAFEFIAFVNRQDEMEKINSLHCKNSPLAKVSQRFIDEHPNPYIEVFENLAASPNAYPLPEIGIWPQVNDELQNAVQEVYLMQTTPQEALDAAQKRVKGFYDRFVALQERRDGKQH